MDRQPYLLLIGMKQWADQGLAQAIAGDLERLGEEERSRLRRILDHIHAVDRIFQHHLLGTPHAYTAARSDVLPTLQALAEGSLEVGAWYVAYVAGLPPQTFEEPVEFVFTSGKPARMSRAEILLHVCLHGAYHRGAAGALLQLQGLKPNRDAVTDFLEDTG